MKKNKDLKYYKKSYRLLSWVTYVGLSIIILLLLSIGYVSLPFNYNTKIEFDGLNESEIIRVEHILQQVKPVYLDRSRNIKFISDDDSINCGISSFKKYKDYVRGCNTNRKIVIRYTETPYLWDVVCHELLHNWISEQEIVYDITNYKVCYK